MTISFNINWFSPSFSEQNNNSTKNNAITNNHEAQMYLSIPWKSILTSNVDILIQLGAKGVQLVRKDMAN